MTVDEIVTHQQAVRDQIEAEVDVLLAEFVGETSPSRQIDIHLDLDAVLERALDAVEAAGSLLEPGDPLMRRLVDSYQVLEGTRIQVRQELTLARLTQRVEREHAG